MVEGLVRRAALAALLGLSACKGCERPAPPAAPFDCGATRGADTLEVVRAAPGYPSPRACLLDKLTHCAPATLQHLDDQSGTASRGAVEPGPKGCAVSWTQTGHPPVTCTAGELIHKMVGGVAQPGPASDRLLLLDCSDGRKHML